MSAARAMMETASSVAWSKFGGLEAILAMRNIKIDMKLKVAKSKNIINKCHNE